MVGIIFYALYLEGIRIKPVILEMENLSWFTSIWLNAIVIFLIIPVLCWLLDRRLRGKILIYLVLANLIYITVAYNTFIDPLTRITYKMHQNRVIIGALKGNSIGPIEGQKILAIETSYFSWKYALEKELEKELGEESHRKYGDVDDSKFLSRYVHMAPHFFLERLNENVFVLEILEASSLYENNKELFSDALGMQEKKEVWRKILREEMEKMTRETTNSSTLEMEGLGGNP